MSYSSIIQFRSMHARFCIIKQRSLSGYNMERPNGNGTEENNKSILAIAFSITLLNVEE